MLREAVARGRQLPLALALGQLQPPNCQRETVRAKLAQTQRLLHVLEVADTDLVEAAVEGGEGLSGQSEERCGSDTWQCNQPPQMLYDLPGGGGG